ncbi:PopZ family protein [Sinorhizobium alkalisoli]|uniref:PopZ family protein n=1 Tax=Sinorhizobium alkalisoli TaxID=1752398 RepID=UPI00124DA14C|nr:PopZ family protein [Sinorhizobium alkalisoli]MCA1492788.1 PopZ family protein [Ensifer sp. NBAIM29]QFI66163.1 hypothetical protein EKH55_1289 [Sinorhizobium alkalisoli]
MAQLNVAREPSMDEILASIRKIIESNETGPIAASDPQSFEDGDDDDIELAIDSEMQAAVFRSADEDIASMRRAPAVPEEELVAARTHGATPPSPLSLADVAARVRAASERHGASYAGREPPLTEARELQDSPVLTSRMAAVASSAVTPSSVSVEAAAPAAALPDTAAEPEKATSPAKVNEQSTTADSNSEAEKASGAIVSPAVGRQVARAFDDLAHAVEQGPRRSFDEIAETMLRPMLQEWLDDNLPTLVERLVREEIERVARGPRR